MSTLNTELSLNVVVEYDVHAATRGARDSLGGKADAGPPLEPDEPAWVEITDVRYGEFSIMQYFDQDVIDGLVVVVEQQLAEERHGEPDVIEPDFEDIHHEGEAL